MAIKIKKVFLVTVVSRTRSYALLCPTNQQRQQLLWLLGAFCVCIGYFIKPEQGQPWDILALVFASMAALVGLILFVEGLLHYRRKRLERQDFAVEGEAVALEEANVASPIEGPDAVVVR